VYLKVAPSTQMVEYMLQVQSIDPSLKKPIDSYSNFDKGISPIVKEKDDESELYELSWTPMESNYTVKYYII